MTNLRQPDARRALQIALIVSFVGGFLDAYSYVGWGGVFAGAQSVNIILAAIAVAQGHGLSAAHHLPSILAFCMGVAAATVLKARPLVPSQAGQAAWILVLQSAMLLLIGLFSASIPGALATAAMAFAAALQLTYFGHADGWTYNSTMTTGNLRNLIAAATSVALDRDHAAAEHAIGLSKAIAAFMLGGGIGGLATLQFQGRAICMAVPVLLVGAAVLSRSGNQESSSVQS